MKKQYFVSYYLDFGNTYSLYYAECPEDFAALPANAERISRRRAFELCARERRARKEDPAFSGFADSRIAPAAGDYDQQDVYGVIGYIIPRRKYHA